MISLQDDESLINAIRSAFAGVTHPGDERLLSSDSFDGSEIESFRKDLMPPSWEQISTQLIDYHYDVLPFFAPEAYRFFLPAYLLRGLTSCTAEPANNVIEFVVYNLIMPEDSGAADPF